MKCVVARCLRMKQTVGRRSRGGYETSLACNADPLELARFFIANCRRVGALFSLSRFLAGETQTPEPRPRASGGMASSHVTISGFTQVFHAVSGPSPPHILWANASSSIKQCASLCAKDGECTSFAWCPNDADRVCEFFDYKVAPGNVNYDLCDRYEKQGSPQAVASPPAPSPSPSPPPQLPFVLASPPPLLAASRRRAQGSSCAQTDVVIVVDRSNSIAQGDWNSYAVPFINSLAQRLSATLPSSSRLGVVIYPSQPGANRGDTSGNAAAIFGGMKSIATAASTIASYASFAPNNSASIGL